MEAVDFSFGSFALTFTDRGYVWYFAVHPEMYPAGNGIAPTGNYFIYCTHPTNGSCFYVLEQDENCNWFSDVPPSFIPEEIIYWLGRHIENRSR